MAARDFGRAAAHRTYGMIGRTDQLAPALSVAGATIGDVSTALVSPGFVGRVPELAALADALDTSKEGRAATVLIGGEAGVGKTRLVSEFAERAAQDGARVVVGQCVELGEDGLPFAPIAGALRDLADQLGAETLLELAGPGRDMLPSLLPELGTGMSRVEEGRGRLFEVVTILLERVSADRPLLLVVEDLHWADGSTRHLLQFIVRALSSARVMLAVTYRSDEIHRRHPLRPFLAELDRVRGVRRVTVPRLTEEEVAEQLAGIFAHEPVPRVVKTVFNRSEGIPFFVEELARASVDDSSPPLPDSLRDLLLVRTEQLSDAAQDVLRLLATGGVRVGDALLSAVAEMDGASLEAALREALSANIITVDGDAYAFRHALLREVLHDDLLPGAHERLHVRYAEALEKNPGLVSSDRAPIETAHHWYAARDQERAFAAYLNAAGQTRRAYAHGETLRMLERALELWHRMPDPAAVAGTDRAGLLHRAARAAEDAGELERSFALVEAALAEPDVGGDADADVVRLASLLGHKAKMLGELGRPGGVALIEQALVLVAASPPSVEKARLLAQLAARHMMDGRYDDAVRVSHEAYATADAVNADDVKARALNVRAPSLIHSGHIAEGLATFEKERVVIGDNLQTLVGYHINYSDALNLLGRYTEAAEVARRGMQKAGQIGFERGLGAMLAGNAAEPLLALGEWAEAEKLIMRTLELDPPYRHAWHLLTLQAWLQLWRGDVSQAEETLADLRDRQAGRVIDPQYRVPAARIAAEIALASDDLPAAWDHVVGALDDAAGPGYLMPLCAVGAAVLGAMRRSGMDVADSDVHLVRDLVEGFDAWGASQVWRAAVAAELAGDDPDAWHEVIGAVDDADGPAHLAVYARLRHGGALLAAGERAYAVDELRTAAAAAGDLGSGLLRQGVHDLARRAGIRLVDQVPAESRSAGLPSLTSREREVLRLVAAGRSNREIGEELFISAKTASVHVSNILAKLGAASRIEAAAMAHREGLTEDAA